MTGVAPEDETAATGTDTPVDAREFAGGSAGGRDGESVQIAYLHSSRVSHSWHQSLLNTIAYDKSLGSNLIHQVPFAVSCSGPNSLPEGRNLAAQHFLDKTDADWLFFVDTDMGFAADNLERLWFAASATERPVVGGLCFALKHVGSDGQGGFRVTPVPTLFEFAHNEKQGSGFANRFKYPPDALVQVAGTGAAFLLIHRRVLEAIRSVDGDRWFDFAQYGDGAQVSEDLSFCWRVGELGIPIFVHTGVKTTHHKEIWLGENVYSQPEQEPMLAQIKAAKKEKVVPNREDRRKAARGGA